MNFYINRKIAFWDEMRMETARPDGSKQRPASALTVRSGGLEEVRLDDICAMGKPKLYCVA